MDIIIGSKNPTKIKSVQNIFKAYNIRSFDVDSNVSAQPFSDEETRQGAINRAKTGAQSTQNAIGIGLEGGVMSLEGDLLLCNWGALVDQDDNVVTASGARIILPKSIAKRLREGIELGDVMDEFMNKEGIRNKEGAIGIFTNNLISREAMFTHVVSLLKGQWDYLKKEQ